MNAIEKHGASAASEFTVTRFLSSEYPKSKKGGWNIGDTVIATSGAKYWCIDAQPYMTRWEIWCTLLTWQGDCDNCGDLYEFQTTKSKFSPRANCKFCRDRTAWSNLRGARHRRLGGVQW